MRDRDFYVNEMSAVKDLKLQPIDSITLVSLAALLADYQEYLQTNPGSSLDQFYDFKKLKLVGQKNDTEEWKDIIEKDPKYQGMIEQNINDSSTEKVK